jgi:hypothetical protein
MRKIPLSASVDLGPLMVHAASKDLEVDTARETSLSMCYVSDERGPSRSENTSLVDKGYRNSTWIERVSAEL